MIAMVKLNVNVDHVATLRQARGTDYPDPVAAALMAEAAGCDGITVHLREDRRHIQDADVVRLRAEVGSMLNLEMAATEEMTDIATKVRPDLVTLVPERREERTTEGGLDPANDAVGRAVTRLHSAGLPVSLFVAPSAPALEASSLLDVAMVELHTGEYAQHSGPQAEHELEQLRSASELATQLGLRVAAGHGLTLANTGALVKRLERLMELNIGHALVSDAVFSGLRDAVAAYRQVIAEGESLRQ